MSPHFGRQTFFIFQSQFFIKITFYQKKNLLEGKTQNYLMIN